jgi:hypothetical protein
VAGRLAGAVLLVDGYEQLGPIDGWLRQAFLPALPADALVVLAGRDVPASPWRTDPGWRSLVAVRRLDHFDEAESDELLALAGVAPPVRAHLVRLGRGHPLAMALLPMSRSPARSPTASPRSPILSRPCWRRCCGARPATPTCPGWPPAPPPG